MVSGRHCLRFGIWVADFSNNLRMTLLAIWDLGDTCFYNHLGVVRGQYV